MCAGENRGTLENDRETEQSDLVEVVMVLVEARNKRNMKWGKKVTMGSSSRNLLVEARTGPWLLS